MRTITKRTVTTVLTTLALAGVAAGGAATANATSWTPSTSGAGVWLQGDVTIKNGSSAPPALRLTCPGFRLISKTFPGGGNAYMVHAVAQYNNCLNDGTGQATTFRLEPSANVQYDAGTGSFSLAFLRTGWTHTSSIGTFKQGLATALPNPLAFSVPWTNGTSAVNPSTIAFNDTPIGSGHYMSGTLTVQQYNAPTVGGLVTINP